MADNVDITAGIGTSIATDDVGGKHYQRVKLAQGADGSATDVSSASPLPVTLANTGANATAVKVDGSAATQPVSVEALPLPSGAATAAKQPALGTAGVAAADVISVQGIASGTALPVSVASVPLPSGAATASEQATQTASLSVLDDWDESDRAKVNPIAGQAGVAGGAGNVSALTQRVVIAADQAALPAAGQGAAGAAVPAGAQYAAGLAATALPTAETAGDLVGTLADKFGRQIVLPGTVRDLRGTQTTTISASTSETTIVTAAASIFNDLELLVISNTSAATDTRIDFRDTTAGSVLFSLYVKAGTTVGFALGGASIPQSSVNTNWTAQCATSTTDIRVYAVFAKNR